MKTLEIIKQYRKAKGLTQEQLGAKLQMAKQTYQSIESGVSKLNIFDFLKIIEILEIPITLFVEDDLIVISKSDLENLEKYSKAIYDITSKISEQNKKYTTNINFKDNHGTINIGDDVSKK